MTSISTLLNFNKYSFHIPKQTKPESQFVNFPFGISLNRSNAQMIFSMKVVKNPRNVNQDFADEMRNVAMKLHTKDQSREGEKESPPPKRSGPYIKGYLKYLVDNKLVFDTLVNIINTAVFPLYGEFQNTGLERSEQLAKDVEWFKEQGHEIPEPSSPGVSYSLYLKKISEKDPQAFLSHFYNIYFAHTAGGQIIGKKIAEALLDNKILEFYVWEGDLSEFMQNVKRKLNKAAASWTEEEKDRCLKETQKSFDYAGELINLISS